MRIIIPNTKTVDEAKGIVERSTEDLFRSAAGGIIQITNVEKSWTGNTMAFRLKASVAFLSTLIEGTAAVTEREVTIDVAIPEAFRRFIAEDKLKMGIESRVRGLLAAS
jgi:hypothetical protein